MNSPSFSQAYSKTAFLTASEVALAITDPFGFWQDHFGDSSQRDSEDEYSLFLMEQGLRIEKELLAARHPQFTDLSGLSFSSALTQTDQLLKFGKAVIYGGAIRSVPMGLSARPDVLVVERGRCEVEEYKLSGKPSESHEIQSLVYAYIFNKAYGLDPGTTIISRKGESFPVAYDESRIETAVRTARRILAMKEPPPPTYNIPSRWHRLQNKTAHDLQDVTLAWNVGPAHARRLHQMDIHTLNDLSKTDFTILKSIKGLGVKKIPQILNSARAQLNREVIRTGRFLLSEEKPKNEIYLDLEGTGELFQDDPGWNCIYLIGLIQIKEGKEFPYRPFLAVQPGDEKGIIREFFDFLDSLEGEYRLYHWDHYERTQLRKASERYGFIEEFNRLIFPQLDDLCRAAQESFVLPTPGYSIKVVAPFFGFHWAQSSSEVDAMKSAMIWYKQAVEGGTRAGLEKVVRYNEDDCRAMIEIKEGFRLLDAGGDVKKG